MRGGVGVIIKAESSLGLENGFAKTLVLGGARKNGRRSAGPGLERDLGGPGLGDPLQSQKKSAATNSSPDGSRQAASVFNPSLYSIDGSANEQQKTKTYGSIAGIRVEIFPSPRALFTNLQLFGRESGMENSPPLGLAEGQGRTAIGSLPGRLTGQIKGDQHQHPDESQKVPVTGAIVHRPVSLMIVAAAVGLNDHKSQKAHPTDHVQGMDEGEGKSHSKNLGGTVAATEVL